MNNMSTIVDGAFINSDPGADPLIGTTFDGNYEIIERIGKGGMGSVYKARHIYLGKLCALKVLRRHSVEPAIWQRFRREARTLSVLSHPNIVNCAAFGIHDNMCFLVMDFVDGINLRDEVETHGPLSEVRVRTIFDQILSALQHAHESGVIHRDLKPDNIMLVKGENDLVKLVDFGIAKIQPEEELKHISHNDLTQHDPILGSPQYVSPEQAFGTELDPRSDLYSLGCVMYFALSGHAPFEDPDLLQIIRKHIEEQPESLPESVSAGMANVVCTAMEKESAHRFHTAADMNIALQKTAQVGSARRNAPKSLSLRGKAEHTNRAKPPAVNKRIRQTLVFLVGALVLIGCVVFQSNIRQFVEENARTAIIPAKTHSFDQIMAVIHEAYANSTRPTSEQYESARVALRELVHDQLASAEYHLSQGDRDYAKAMLEQILDEVKQYGYTAEQLPPVDYEQIDRIATLGAQLGGPAESRSVIYAVALYARQFESLRQPDAQMHLDHYKPLAASLGRYELAKSGLDFKINSRGSIVGLVEAYARGTQYASANELDEAVREFARLTSGSVEFLRPNATSSKSRDELSSRAIREGQILMEMKKHHPAERMFNSAYQMCTTPGNPPLERAVTAAFLLASVRSTQDSKNPTNPTCLPLLDQSIKIATDYNVQTAPMKVVRAQIHFRNDRLDAARKDAQSALTPTTLPLPADLFAIYPLQRQPHLVLGRVALRERNLDLALREFDKAREAMRNYYQDGSIRQVFRCDVAIGDALLFELTRSGPIAQTPAFRQRAIDAAERYYKLAFVDMLSAKSATPNEERAQIAAKDAANNGLATIALLRKAATH